MRSRCPECGTKDYFEPGTKVYCINCEKTVILQELEGEE